MQTAVAAQQDADRPRRRLVYIKKMRFTIGQPVMFAGMEAEIKGRQVTAKGLAIYDIELGPKTDERHQRTVLSNFLYERNSNCLVNKTESLF